MLFNRFALTAFRAKAGLTKSQLAERSGHSRPYITQVEGGDRPNPSVKAIEKWAEILDVDPRALYCNPSADELLRAFNVAHAQEQRAS